ncbi:MAG TPA: hypothetical protein VFW40_07845 [Capsulimonadaceae bacterium]|nr:hypothetical protein [Capsulimonadaceae bacterium]
MPAQVYMLLPIPRRKGWRAAPGWVLLSALLILGMARSTFAQKPAARAAAGAPYRVVEKSGIWWLETPAGKPFFSLGVCCVLQGDTKATFNPKNPGYAAYQHYATPADWAKTTIARLKSWNYTTIGGWSDNPVLTKSPAMDMPFEMFIPIGMGVGAPWLDMWDSAVIAKMDKVGRDAILPVRDDPRLMGYFTDNELGWWNGALFEYTLNKHKPTSGQRRRLIQLLRTTYKDRWSLLLHDFVPDRASSFATLAKGGTLHLRPGGNGMRVIKEFAGIAAKRYYQLVHDIVRKYDKRGLILGDRYQSFYYPDVAAAAGPYLDVSSTNLNANWQDGSVARFYLDTLHKLTQRPVMVTEFYATSTQNRSGNQNSSSGFLVAPTQADRAVVFRNELEWFLSRPYLVGADWFQYFDEPQNGRGDGENYDMGLVDIHDRPYAEITAASKAMNLRELKKASLATLPDITTQGIPRAPADPLAGDTDRTLMLTWDRLHGFVTPQSDIPTADLYTCWDSKALYLGIYSIDMVEKDFYKDGKIPDADRMQVQISGAGLAHPIDLPLRDTAGKTAEEWEANGVRIRRFGPQDNVRNSTVLELPASLFRRAALAPGERIRLHVVFLSHARGYRTEWNVEATLGP